jgi:hypothetical protein
MAKKLVKKKVGGENPKLTKAKQDSARATKTINIITESGLSPKNYPATIKQAVIDTKKPAQVRKELGIKKKGGATKTKKK